LAKEGRSLIIPFLISALILTLSTFFFRWGILFVLSMISWISVGFLIYFFRDPERMIPANENIILSPADGRILSIENIHENEYLHELVQKISIFMSPLNVHINRIPLSGRVEYFRYQPGKFLAAYRAESSTENEQAIIGISNGQTRLLFKQIAGVLARRIVCQLKKDEPVRLGERFGMIKFGSRVELFLPHQIKVQVKLNQSVKGGETILGVILDGHEK